MGTLDFILFRQLLFLVRELLSANLFVLSCHLCTGCTPSRLCRKGIAKMINYCMSSYFIDFHVDRLRYALETLLCLAKNTDANYIK